MIWFASITINLGPTFLSGALAASAGSYGSYGPAPSCPLVRGPYRHYVLNALWIGVNTVCVGLTLFHLKKLHRDLTKVRKIGRCDSKLIMNNLAWSHLKVCVSFLSRLVHSLPLFSSIIILSDKLITES